MNTRTSSLGAAALLAAAALSASPIGAQAPQGDPPAIRNFLQVTPDFCTGGQPRLEHFEALRARGVKAVLTCVRLASTEPRKRRRRSRRRG